MILYSSKFQLQIQNMSLFLIGHIDWQRSNPHCEPKEDNKVTSEMTELINKLPTAASGDNEVRG